MNMEDGKIPVEERLSNLSDSFDSVEHEGCCSGHECGCMGMPTNPEWHYARLTREAVEEIKKLRTENQKLKELEDGKESIS